MMELGPARQTRDKGTSNRVGGSAKRQDARESVGKVAAPLTGDHRFVYDSGRGNRGYSQVKDDPIYGHDQVTLAECKHQPHHLF